MMWNRRTDQEIEEMETGADLREDDSRRIAELEAENARLMAELNDAQATIRELRTINVEPGISLGKARDWRARVAELEAALDFMDWLSKIAPVTMGIWRKNYAAELERKVSGKPTMGRQEKTNAT